MEFHKKKIDKITGQNVAKKKYRIVRILFPAINISSNKNDHYFDSK